MWPRIPRGKSRARHNQDSHLLEAQLGAELLRQGGKKKARRCSDLHKELSGAVESGKRGRKEQSVEHRQDQRRMYEYDSSTGRLAPHSVQKRRSHSQQQQCATSSTKPNQDVSIDSECWMEHSGRSSRLVKSVRVIVSFRASIHADPGIESTSGDGTDPQTAGLLSL